MTRVDIIRMAEQAGFVVDQEAKKYLPNCVSHTHYMIDEPLTRFAALVAAAERQRNLEMVQILVEAEREACAKEADYEATRWAYSPEAREPWWDPLTDDGDALRLAVRLHLHVKQFPILDDGFDDPLGMVEVWREDDDDPLHVEFLRVGDDRLAATRRAIVRAAAAIGKTLANAKTTSANP